MTNPGMYLSVLSLHISVLCFYWDIYLFWHCICLYQGKKVKKEDAMKTTIVKTVIALVGATATAAYAATSGSAAEGSGPLIWFFVGFGALVVLLQAVPALVLFVSMLKGLFATSDKEVTLPKA